MGDAASVLTQLCMKKEEGGGFKGPSALQQ
jgi:hypothetical protein